MAYRIELSVFGCLLLLWVVGKWAGDGEEDRISSHDGLVSVDTRVGSSATREVSGPRRGLGRSDRREEIARDGIQLERGVDLSGMSSRPEGVGGSYLALEEAAKTVGLEARNDALLDAIMEAESGREAIEFFVDQQISLPVVDPSSSSPMALAHAGVRLIEEMGIEDGMKLVEGLLESREALQLKSIMISETARRNPEKAAGLLGYVERLGANGSMVALNLSQHVPIADLSGFLGDCEGLGLNPRLVLQANTLRMLDGNEALLLDLGDQFVGEGERAGFAFNVASALLAGAEKSGAVRVDQYLGRWDPGNMYWEQAINVLSEEMPEEFFEALDSGLLEYSSIPAGGLEMLVGNLAREDAYDNVIEVLGHMEDGNGLMEQVSGIWVKRDVEGFAAWAPTLPDGPYKAIAYKALVEGLDGRPEQSVWAAEMNRLGYSIDE